MAFAVKAPEIPSVAIKESDDRFPVHRIYCVGRNYGAHAIEMGSDPKREPPFFFCKPADAVIEEGAPIPYPPQTNNLHHEVELVVAIKGGGSDISVADAASQIFGYAVGIDLTRRDLQKQAKDTRRPWDAAKAFDKSAPISAIVPLEKSALSPNSIITLDVNGERRQEATIGDLIWSVDETIAALSTLFQLKPGDLIFTGTPAGVAALHPGDQIHAHIEGVCDLKCALS